MTSGLLIRTPKALYCNINPLLGKKRAKRGEHLSNGVYCSDPDLLSNTVHSQVKQQYARGPGRHGSTTKASKRESRGNPVGAHHPWPFDVFATFRPAGHWRGFTCRTHTYTQTRTRTRNLPNGEMCKTTSRSLVLYEASGIQTLLNKTLLHLLLIQMPFALPCPNVLFLHTWILLPICFCFFITSTKEVNAVFVS